MPRPKQAHSCLPAEGRRELEPAARLVGVVQDVAMAEAARAKSLEGARDWKAQGALVSHWQYRAAHPRFRRHKRLVQYLQCPTLRRA